MKATCSDCYPSDCVGRCASPFVEDALTPRPHWKRQSFRYYAAHFLVGIGMSGYGLDGAVRALAGVLEKEYLVGVEHGRNTPSENAA